MTDHQWGLPHSARGSDLKRLRTPVTSPPAEAAIVAAVATHSVKCHPYIRLSSHNDPIRVDTLISTFHLRKI